MGGFVRWERVRRGGAVVAMAVYMCVIIRIMRPEFDGDRTQRKKVRVHPLRIQ